MENWITFIHTSLLADPIAFGENGGRLRFQEKPSIHIALAINKTSCQTTPVKKNLFNTGALFECEFGKCTQFNFLLTGPW